MQSKLDLANLDLVKYVFGTWALPNIHLQGRHFMIFFLGLPKLLKSVLFFQSKIDPKILRKKRAKRASQF